MVLTQVFGTVVPTKVPSLTQLILPDLASVCYQLHLQCIQFHASWLALQYSQHTRLSLHTCRIYLLIYMHMTWHHVPGLVGKLPIQNVSGYGAIQFLPIFFPTILYVHAVSMVSFQPCQLYEAVLHISSLKISKGHNIFLSYGCSQYWHLSATLTRWCTTSALVSPCVDC